MVILLGMLAAADAGAPPLQVEYRGGRLSVTADGIPLEDVLGAIAQRTGLQISGAGVLGDPVSVSLVAVPLRDALRRLLRSRDYVLIEDQAGPRRLIVQSRGSGGDTPSPPGVVPGALARPGVPWLLPDEAPAGEADPPAGIATQYGMVAFPAEDGGGATEEAADDTIIK